MENRLKRKLAQGKTAVGFWVTLESPTLTEIAVTLGYDWVCIDAEHGHLDFKEVVEHLRVTRNTDTTPIVRIQEVHEGLIKRMLDIGAEGLIIPQVQSAADVERAVRLAKYPPWGVRGVGGERSTRWGLDVKNATATANDEVMIIPLIEHVAAGRAIDAILDVRGVDAIFFGPADYSASAGHLGQWEGPGVAEEILAVKARADARGIASGIMAKGPAVAQMRREQGFRMIGLGSDTGMVIRASIESMQALGVKVPGQ